MAPSSPNWRQALVRQLRTDADLRGPLIAAVTASTIGAISAISWSIFSRCFFAMGAITLLASVFAARKAKANPVMVLQAAFLGFVFGASILSALLSYSSTSSFLFSLYLSLMAIFHFTEFLFTAITNRRGLQADSFLLNHSTAYWIAACTAWAEFWIEAYLLPGIKTQYIGLVGMGVCVAGEVIRKMGMLHAGNGFTHRMATSKKPDHRLCTTGIYAWIRHPGYAGWLMWSVGTQIVLCNPLCTVAYAIVSWRFFDDRIREEERDLIDFFGGEYIEYQEKVWGGVPFVEGYRVSRG